MPHSGRRQSGLDNYLAFLTLGLPLTTNSIRMELIVYRRFLLASAVLLVLSACATSTLDPQSKASIRRVYVEPVQLPAKPTVVPAEGGALQVVSGKAMPAPADAAKRFQEIVQSGGQLSGMLEQWAKNELTAKGYQLATSPNQSDAKIRFVVYHGLGVAGVLSSDRGISMTVNMEMVRSADDKRLVFAIANQIKDPAKLAKVKFAPYEEWFSNETMVADQYRVVGEALVGQALSGL